MKNKLPMSFKILIGLNSIMCISPLIMLGFYEFNNVVSDNGMDVGPLKIYYFAIFLLGLTMILLLLYTKKIAIVTESIYGIMMILSGFRGNISQVIIGVIILILILNNSSLKYTELYHYKSKSYKKKKQ